MPLAWFDGDSFWRTGVWMKLAWSIVIVAVAWQLSSAQNQSTSDSQPLAEAQASGYVPVHKFDPKRDAAADIQAAIKEAQRTGKRVLLDVGGDWCLYCRQMDQFFEKHPDILQLRDQNFITVAVFYSSENKNEKVLAHYPKVLGIPHFYVLDKDGRLLRSQHVLELRAGETYDPNKMTEFLTKWSPPAAAKVT
jgi:thiol:disulfide interchange protein